MSSPLFYHIISTFDLLVNAINLGLYISRVSDYNLKTNCISIFTFTSSVDSDEVQRYAAFHLVLHCLRKYPFDTTFTQIRWLRYYAFGPIEIFTIHSHPMDQYTLHGPNRIPPL